MNKQMENERLRNMEDRVRRTKKRIDRKCEEIMAESILRTDPNT